MSGEALSLVQARRIALAAQGLAGPRPAAPPGSAVLLRMIGRLGLLQLDSVSVLARAHYLPLFSRLGSYDRGWLDRAAAHDGRVLAPRRRRLFEYWAHEASLLPVEAQPLLRWRMERAMRGEGTWSGLARWARDNPQTVERVFREVEERGRLGVSELAEAGRRSGSWWGWNDGKAALEWLFWTGRLTASGRRGFERIYDLPERVLPEAVRALPTPEPGEAHRRLLRIAADALGVATASDLRDYFRLPLATSQRALAEIVEAGELRPVRVEGWRQQAYLAPSARLPRRATARALLAPFDPLVWERDRTERLFGFRYRIEIYTPASKRQHGYYVLPFLMGERLAARVDLKSERSAGRLLVRAAHGEPSIDRSTTAEALALELGLMAGWLGLGRVEVETRGDLAPDLLACSGIRPAVASALDDEPVVVDADDLDEGAGG
ncbi:MAG TPA: winged helix-turn-helix domain-containing protein [Geminicoccaceae bacterium]|nr:winged helix-turn-helix domain-containing protein [Geminicoccus sp.]HMU48870.1 winged helix-turn-helix domain-containing protein [Geminicoccaceae bacterium]